MAESLAVGSPFASILNPSGLTVRGAIVAWWLQHAVFINMAVGIFHSHCQVYFDMAVAQVDMGRWAACGRSCLLLVPSLSLVSLSLSPPREPKIGHTYEHLTILLSLCPPHNPGKKIFFTASLLIFSFPLSDSS